MLWREEGRKYLRRGMSSGAKRQSYMHAGFQQMLIEFLLCVKHWTCCHSVVGEKNIIQIIYKWALSMEDRSRYPIPSEFHSPETSWTWPQPAPWAWDQSGKQSHCNYSKNKRFHWSFTATPVVIWDRGSWRGRKLYFLHFINAKTKAKRGSTAEVTVELWFKSKSLTREPGFWPACNIALLCHSFFDTHSCEIFSK